MVSSTTIISIIIQGIISIGLPLFFLVYFIRKYPGSWKPILVGLSVFIVFSQILEATLHQFVLFINPLTRGLMNNPLMYAVYASLAAGIFEEVGRFIGFRYLLKKFHSWKDGIAYGIGHGGIEAILLVGFTAISNLAIAFLINYGVFDLLYDVSDDSTIEALSGIKFQLISLPSHLFIMGGLERIIVFPIQLGLSLLVLYGVRNRKYTFLLYAVAFHAIVDFLPALSHKMSIHILWIEGYLLIMAIASLIFIFKSKTMFARSEENLEHN